MNVEEQIEKYISSQPEPKRSDLQALHRTILHELPAGKLWFLDGKNSEINGFEPQHWLWISDHSLRGWNNPGVLSDWSQCKHKRHIRLHSWD